jgi:hypothetical protein
VAHVSVATDADVAGDPPPDSRVGTGLDRNPRPQTCHLSATRISRAHCATVSSFHTCPRTRRLQDRYLPATILSIATSNPVLQLPVVDTYLLSVLLLVQSREPRNIPREPREVLREPQLALNTPSISIRSSISDQFLLHSTRSHPPHIRHLVLHLQRHAAFIIVILVISYLLLHQLQLHMFRATLTTCASLLRGKTSKA